MTDLQPLLNPESIAVVGASPRGNRGSQILQNLQRFGSTARIYPVHPRARALAGLRAYPDLESLPETVDFVAIALDADSSLDVLEQSVKLGTRAGLIIASGFGEGGAGLERRSRLVDIVSESGFLLCGPNCYGILNAGAGFAAFSGQVVDPFVAGGVAIVMQSGALTHSLTDSAIGRDLTLSHLITTGNELSVTLGQYVRALVDDSTVDVIGVFIEGLRDINEFARACIEARRRGKPVVALTVGRSELGQRAAMAHTGAITGGGEAMSGLLRRCGVVQTADLDEFRETLVMFSMQAKPTADGVALASISGGGTGLMADLAETLEVAVPSLQTATVDRIQEILPGFATVANPLDVTGAAVEDPTLTEGALAALQSDTGVGLVALALNVGNGSRGQKDVYRDQARALARRAKQHETPVVAVSLTSGSVDDVLAEMLREQGVRMLSGAVPSLKAISSWMAWHCNEEPAPYESEIKVSALKLGDHSVLAGSRAMKLVADAGIAVPDSYLALDVANVADEWESLSTPVVLKIESDGLAHKTEIGGVALGITQPEDLESAARRMRHAISEHAADVVIGGFLVQSQITEPAVECMVGVVRDAQVGLTLSVVPGGVLAELGGRATTTPVPATKADIEFLIDSSPLARLLDGYRGAPRADRSALVELIVRFSDLVHRCGSELSAAEMNPVLALPDGRGAVAVDALFVKKE